MAVLGRAAHGWLGAPGVHALALLSGLADVDAILITVSRMQADGTLGTGSAVLAVGLAVASNQVTKAVIARSAGSAALARQVLLGYAVALLTGTLAAVTDYMAPGNPARYRLLLERVVHQDVH